MEWPADKIERKKVDDLIPYARNARMHSDEKVAQIAASIKEWGWTTPVLVDEDDLVALNLEAERKAHRRMYQEFLGVAQARGKAPGWAYHLFKSKVGTDPLPTWHSLPALPPSDEATRYAKYQMIRFAKGRAKGNRTMEENRQIIAEQRR